MFELEYEMRARQEDFIRMAEKERLILQARGQLPKRMPRLKLAAARLGRSLCRAGSWLEMRFGIPDPLPTATHASAAASRMRT